VATPHILIVEDDMMIALDLESIVLEAVDADTTVVSSVESAMLQVNNGITFAFLDIDVRDGKTYRLAERLNDRAIPFAFVSGADRARLPSGLRDTPYIAKPYVASAVTKALKENIALPRA
jgi:DNA-binding LytR/AlgR family response regulator